MRTNVITDTTSLCKALKFKLNKIIHNIFVFRLKMDVIQERTMKSKSFRKITFVMCFTIVLKHHTSKYIIQ